MNDRVSFPFQFCIGSRNGPSIPLQNDEWSIASLSGWYVLCNSHKIYCVVVYPMCARIQSYETSLLPTFAFSWGKQITLRDTPEGQSIPICNVHDYGVRNRHRSEIANRASSGWEGGAVGVAIGMRRDVRMDVRLGRRSFDPRKILRRMAVFGTVEISAGFGSGGWPAGGASTGMKGPTDRRETSRWPGVEGLG